MPPNFAEYVPTHALESVIRLAIEEDLGPDRLDATSSLLIDESATGQARIVAREAGVLSGLATLPNWLSAFHENLRHEAQAQDGQALSAGDVVAELSGPLQALLAAERPILNMLSHLSGIATQTSAFVQAVQGTGARIVDTRKTLPGYRGLQKYAVACGGGATHRMGLYDAVLVKDNHLSGLPASQWTMPLASLIDSAKHRIAGLKFVMVEVDTLEQLEAVLPAKPDLVLLDNMPPSVLARAVAERDQLAPEVRLEASGGVTFKTVRAIAESGVDRISIGALTHSLTALDLGLDRG